MIANALYFKLYKVMLAIFRFTHWMHYNLLLLFPFFVICYTNKSFDILYNNHWEENYDSLLKIEIINLDKFITDKTLFIITLIIIMKKNKINK